MKYGIIALLLLASVGCASNSNGVGMIPANAPVQHISMAARQFEFNPSTINVPQGTHVILDVTSMDVTHGISIPKYDISMELPPHQKMTMEFYANEQGTFPFKCSNFCGRGHFGMKGDIIVGPPVAAR